MTASLSRRLGSAGVLFLTLSATTPASSVYIVMPGMLAGAGSGALLALLIAGVVCTATAYVYAELSSAWPVAGGEYVMVGATLGPLAGFVMLGINVINNLLFPAVMGLGLSDVLAAVVPGLPVIPLAVAMIAASTLIAVFDIRLNAWVTGAFLLLELVVIGVLVWLGAASPVRALAPLLLHPVAGAALAPASPVAIGLAAVVAILALNGYGMAVYFGEELRDAPAKIARIILLALAVTLAVEMLPLAAVLVAAPDLPKLFAAADPFGLFVARRGGPGLAGWMAIGVAIAVFNAAIASVLASARFFYATGRDRAWGRPVDAWLAAVHPRFASPWVATLITGGAGIAACFVPLPLLLVVSGAGIVVTYAGVSLAALVGRRTGASAHGLYRMPWFPLAPLLTLVALAGIVWASWLDPVTGTPGLIATAAQMALAAGYYWLVLRRRGWVAA